MLAPNFSSTFYVLRKTEGSPRDRVVDGAYVVDAKVLGAKSKWNSDRERVAFLFELYQRLTGLPENAERS